MATTEVHVIPRRAAFRPAQDEPDRRRRQGRAHGRRKRNGYVGNQRPEGRSAGLTGRFRTGSSRVTAPMAAMRRARPRSSNKRVRPSPAATVLTSCGATRPNHRLNALPNRSAQCCTGPRLVACAHDRFPPRQIRPQTRPKACSRLKPVLRKHSDEFKHIRTGSIAPQDVITWLRSPHVGGGGHCAFWLPASVRRRSWRSSCGASATSSSTV